MTFAETRPPFHKLTVQGIPIADIQALRIKALEELLRETRKELANVTGALEEDRNALPTGLDYTRSLLRRIDKVLK